VRLLLAESLVLALSAGLVGVLLAWWAVAVVGPLVPADLQRLKTITIDGRAVLLALGASITCVVLTGLLPAVRSTRRDVLQTLQQSSSRTASRHSRLRQTIIALEMALATLLLVGGGLMANAMIRLLQLDHGYDAAHVLTIQVRLPQRGTDAPEPSTEFVQRALDAARRVPGVVAAGATSAALLDRTLYGGSYRVEGFSAEWMNENADNGSGACCTTTHRVSPGTFAALGVPIVNGRTFTPADSTASPRVAIINHRLARKFPAGMNPVGHWLVSSRDPADRRLIVGVVGDIRDMSLEWQPAQAIYLPIGERGAAAMTLVVKAAGAPRALVGPTRRAIQLGAGPVVISNVSTLDDLVLGSVDEYRLNAWLFGSFGAVGLLIAAVGIVGVVAYSVAHRTREIGLRLALGATPTAVRRLVAQQALAPAVAGLLVGLGAAAGLSRFLARFLYEVQPTDMPTYAITSGVLLAAAVVAALLPARRASRIDPMLALRAE
jgi:predicted permease